MAQIQGVPCPGGGMYILRAHAHPLLCAYRQSLKIHETIHLFDYFNPIPFPSFLSCSSLANFALASLQILRSSWASLGSMSSAAESPASIISAAAFDPSPGGAVGSASHCWAACQLSRTEKVILTSYNTNENDHCIGRKFKSRKNMTRYL